MNDAKYIKCTYCNEEKPANSVKEWEKTGELVCYDCRIELLDEEFAEMWEKLK